MGTHITDTDTFYTIDIQLYAPATDMSDFEEEFEIPAASEVDPAAEFLAKEQASELSSGMSKLYVAKEEPEFMRKWKEEQKERLEKKDQEETAAMEELKVKAKQELEDWYKRYETQIEKTKSCNREEETKYEGNELNGIEPGSEWERVAKHCDFSAKAPGHTKDVSRLRSIMLQLKQNQTVQA